MATDPFTQYAADPDVAADPFTQYTQAEDQPEPETADAEPTEDEPKLTMEEWREVSEIFALQDVLNKAIADFTKKRRKNMDKVVERASKEFSTDQFKIEPETLDGERQTIAKLSVKRTAPSTQINEGEFFAWCKENRPDLIVKETIPAVPERVIEAQPERVEERLRIGAAETVLKDAQRTDDGAIITEDGVPVEGLTHHKGGEYDGFALTYGTKRALAAAALETLFRNGFKARDTAQIVAQAQLEQGN